MKKVLLGVVATLFIASMALAQHPQGAITGRILEDGTNNGIWGAVVTATKITGDPFVRTTYSGWNGHYVAHHLPAGSYVVSATKLGWSEGVYPDTIVVNNDLHENIDIYLTEVPISYGSIAGTVTDASTTNPIEDAYVVVRGPGFWNYHHTMTAADGSYMVDDLIPGDYTVTAHKEDYFPGEYPDPVTIDGNDTTGIDIALAPVVPTGIRGTVTDIATGNPIEGALVHSYDVNTWHHHRYAYTDANGDYEIETRPGEYRVRAYAEGYLMEEYPTNVIVPETGFVEDIDFALTGFSFGSISGTVTDTSGAPLENARVIARKYDSWFGRCAWTDENGDYTISELLPGDYRVHAYKWGYMPAVYPDTVVVPDGGNVIDIDFVLTPPLPNDGVISGTVTDDSTGLAIEGASLIAIGHHTGPWHRFVFRRVFTDENGDYVFDNLPRIPFKIHAHAEGYVGEFYDDVHSYWDATPVTPDTSGIDIALAPRENPGIYTISGRVQDPAGQFVDGGVVLLMSDGQIVDLVGTDLEGYYGFTDLQPGTYEVSAFTPYGEGVLENPVEILFNNFSNADIVIAVTSTDDNPGLLPEKAALSQNYPNPFNAYTTISFNLPSTEDVELSIYNLAGQKVATLQNGLMNAGEHNIIWNGCNNNGTEVASGIYFYRLSAGDLTETRPMTFLK
ncbi:MAG: carboxypeptidase regulatory-like domain-containing protein [Candidatus Zixiibacteriota bacterium]|nr:MAG: carboxypeptidase regulatory-like domain-containing protein [candidate division Zixibacteria bacterium]